MDILGLDLTAVPWPLFLLIIITAFFVLFYINIHLPMAEDLELYKTKFAAKLDIFDGHKSELISLHIVLDEIKKDQNGISIKTNKKIEELELHMQQTSILINDTKKLISDRFSSNDSVVEKNMNRLDDIREKLLILIAAINRYDIGGRNDNIPR